MQQYKPSTLSLQGHLYCDCTTALDSISLVFSFYQPVVITDCSVLDPNLKMTLQWISKKRNKCFSLCICIILNLGKYQYSLNQFFFPMCIWLKTQIENWVFQFTCKFIQSKSTLFHASCLLINWNDLNKNTLNVIWEEYRKKGEVAW